MLKIQFYKLNFQIILTNLILLFIMSLAYANSTKYLCIGDTNEINLKFDNSKRVIEIGNNKPTKYWGEANVIFWNAANDHTIHEYTFKLSYNKLSAELKIKSHNLVSSKEKWHYYKCRITQ